jgi:CheY-like chemotaxis protein
MSEGPILLDINLPKTDGPEVLRRIRDQDRARSLPPAPPGRDG